MILYFFHYSQELVMILADVGNCKKHTVSAWVEVLHPPNKVEGYHSFKLHTFYIYIIYYLCFIFLEPRKPVGIRRSNSLDRGPSAIGPGPHKMFDRDPRFFTMGPRRNLQHMRPGILGDDRMNQPRPMFHGQMPPPNSNIPKGGLPPGIPAGPGIPQGVRPRFMGAPQQRMMTRPPPGSVIYRHPNHPNMRMAFVPMNQGIVQRYVPFI